MNTRPSMQFYPNDWIGDTELSKCAPSTRGIWVTAICRMWHSNRFGYISGTKGQLCRSLGCNDAEFELFIEELKSTKFGNLTLANEILTVINRRMIQEQKKREANAERQKRHYYKNVKHEDGNPNAKLTLPSSSSSSSSSSKKEINKEKRRSKNCDFDRFWSVYPRKVGKKKCQAIWKRLRPDKELIDRIVEKVIEYIGSEQWQKEGGQFIPHPSTWLNGGRWDDVVDKPQNQTAADQVAALKAKGEL